MSELRDPRSPDFTPDALRAIIGSVTAIRDVGVIRTQDAHGALDFTDTIFVASVPLSELHCYCNRRGLWTVISHGFRLDGVTWFEIADAEVDRSYTSIFRACFSPASIELHCDVLQELPGGVHIRRFQSAAGAIFVSQRPLDPADPLFILRERGDQIDTLWHISSASQSVRIVVTDDQTTGITIRFSAEVEGVTFDR